MKPLRISDTLNDHAKFVGEAFGTDSCFHLPDPHFLSVAFSCCRSLCLDFALSRALPPTILHLHFNGLYATLTMQVSKVT